MLIVWIAGALALGSVLGVFGILYFLRSTEQGRAIMAARVEADAQEYLKSLRRILSELRNGAVGDERTEAVLNDPRTASPVAQAAVVDYLRDRKVILNWDVAKRLDLRFSVGARYLAQILRENTPGAHEVATAVASTPSGETFLREFADWGSPDLHSRVAAFVALCEHVPTQAKDSRTVSKLWFQLLTFGELLRRIPTHFPDSLTTIEALSNIALRPMSTKEELNALALAISIRFSRAAGPAGKMLVQADAVRNTLRHAGNWFDGTTSSFFNAESLFKAVIELLKVSRPDLVPPSKA